MDAADFIDSTTGTLIPTLEHASAFVPAPLPPKIDLGSIALSMASAMQAIGELKGACRRLQNPYVLVRPLQRREALTSSAMEGTFTTDDELLLAEAGVKTNPDDSTREVYNYLDALSSSLEMLDKLPISHRVLKSAHQTLLSGLSGARGANKRPGEYKKEQNWIGGITIDKARFVPPPAAETMTCMDQLEAYINRETTDFPTPLIDLALVHYQIEAIHPFADGNGRVGRMLISLMAVHSGLLDMPILYMSPTLEKYKNNYIDLMYGVSSRGAWAEWINFFFEKLAESCREAIEIIDRLIDLQAEYRAKAANLGRSAGAITLVDHLFERPALTVRDAQRRLNVTYPAAKNTIDKLVEAEILIPFEGIYPKLFIAPAIVRISRPK
ncbi:MAG: Fic family protein [Siculibacillus sp.]|nr:Fic family protein [Siculibacillus sp.]